MVQGKKYNARDVPVCLPYESVRMQWEASKGAIRLAGEISTYGRSQAKSPTHTWNMSLPEQQQQQRSYRHSIAVETS